MLKLTNPWLGYFDRSYEQIKKSLLQRLATSNPEITDHSEGNILVIIISMFSGVAEMIGLYIDTMSREAYLSTAQRFSSIVKLVRPLDYRIKSYVPATVDITVTAVDGSGNPVNVATTYGILSGTKVKTTNNIEFITTESAQILAGQSSVLIPAKQQVRVIADVLGVTSGVANQEVILLAKYADGTMELSINSEIWELQDTLGLSGPTDKHFIIDVNEDRQPYIKFGNGTNGKIPTAAFDILGTYYTTEGLSGNQINAETITTLVTVLTIPAGVTAFKVTNLLGPDGGADIETIETIRINAPLSIRTLMRAVTRQDFRDILRMAPGVLAGDIKFCCGKCIDIYIVPIDGGTASLALLQATDEWLKCKKLTGKCMNVKAAGVTQIFVSVTVYGKYRVDAITLANLTEAALVDYGAPLNQTINATVSLSDIIAKIDNIAQVERVELNFIWAQPYARPIFNNLQLTWNRQLKPTAITKARYKVVYTALNTFNIYRDTVILTPATLLIPWENDDIIFTIQPGTYTIGDTWEFTVYPYGKTIQLDDFTMPVINPGVSIIEVVPTNRDGSCDSNC